MLPETSPSQDLPPSQSPPSQSPPSQSPPSQSLPLEMENSQTETSSLAAESIEEATGSTDSSPLRKIEIGSQRDAAAKLAQPKVIQEARANPLNLNMDTVDVVAEPEMEIRSLAGLGEDLEAEIEAALANVSMDQVIETSEAAGVELEPNTRVKAVVTKIHNDSVFFKLNGQFEGIASHQQFKVDPSEGDLIEVIVRGLNKEDNLYDLAVPGATVGTAEWETIAEGNIVDARVTGSNTGGLEVAVNNLKGFIPASQIDIARVEDFSQFVNQKFPCVVVEVNPEKRKLVLSRRAILEREQEEKRKLLLQELEPGQLREGIVTRLMDFGAFVDLGGLEGLIHVSKLAWTRVRHPKEVVKVGERVNVKVEKVTEGGSRISLSLRDTVEHPWKSVSGKLRVDDVVTGKVTRTMDFGAFVELTPGIEGLVHISELSYKRVPSVAAVVKEGDKIEVKILSIDTETQKISLSHKACLEAPQPKDAPAKVDETPEPPRPLAVPSCNEPLKGGRDRDSGGGNVGLNW